MLKQISVYAENKKGTMKRITSILQKEQINIWGSVTNEGAEFGVTRMVVSEPEKAVKALEADGIMCRLIDVIGVEMEDEVGNLDKLLGALLESNINVNYIYLSFNRDSGKPVLVFQSEEIGEVEDCIKAKGFRVV